MVIVSAGGSRSWAPVEENVLTAMRATPTVAARIPNAVPSRVNRGVVLNFPSNQMPASRGTKSEKSIVQLKFMARPQAFPIFTWYPAPCAAIFDTVGVLPVIITKVPPFGKYHAL